MKIKRVVTVKRYGWRWFALLLIALSLLPGAGSSYARTRSSPPPPDPDPPQESAFVPQVDAQAPQWVTAGEVDTDSPLINPDFEGGWDKNTPSDVYNAYGNYVSSYPIGEIFTPNSWTVYFKQGLPVPWNPGDSVGFAQPEVHTIERAVPFLDPPRIYSGNWAVKLFTFYKIHDAGLYQQVPVRPGSIWELSAMVHAWTSEEDLDPPASTGDPFQANQMVGLDPTGGLSPFASSVVWSAPSHIYDTYTRTRKVNVVAQGNRLTVFLRSWVKWPYKHNDVYWDSVSLEATPYTIFMPVWFHHSNAVPPDPPDPPPSNPGQSPFGLVFVNPAEPGLPLDVGRYQKAEEIGVTWDRWPLYWYHVETSAGQYNWAAYDAVVEADLSHGLQVNPILMGTPGFYATAGLEIPAPTLGLHLLDPDQVDGLTASSMSVPAALYEPVFADGSDNPAPNKIINPNNPWANLVYRVVRRYQPGGELARAQGWPADWGIKVWEIWNEPDLFLFWNGSVADYARLLKVGALAARHADPEATIMTGGLADPPAPGYLEALMNELSRDPDPTLRDAQDWYFDAVALHSYAWSWHVGERIRQARNLLSLYRTQYPNLGEKSFWINETGVPVWNDYPGPTWQSNGEANFMATMEEQAAYTIQNAVYALYNGAATVFHFQLYDGCGNDPPGTDFPPDALYLCDQGLICASASAFGLWRNKTSDTCYRQHPQPDTARPAFNAYRTAVRTLSGVQPLWHQQPGGDQEWFAFYRPDTGQRIIVMWARYHHAVTANVPAVANQAILLDQYGVTTSLNPQSGQYAVSLPAATNLNTPHPPDGSASIGGRPFFLIEDWHPTTD
jgi:hypothetical protein